MEKKIAVIRGDGIGVEIVNQALRVLDKIAEKYGHTFRYVDVTAGGCAIDAFGEPLPEKELQKCLDSDSVLLGAVGGPKWDTLEGSQRPERALLGVRQALGLFANIRPSCLFKALENACPLKQEIIEGGLDLVIVRELIGGAYFGKREILQTEGGKTAYDTMIYSEMEVERIGRVAFETARKRRGKLTSVDKANVLESSRLWREVMHRLKDEYPDVEYSDMLVDNTAMQLVRNPGQFDVIVTENMFGDILSDEASMITGSIGMIPSSSLGEGSRGMYEPIHGSAPDIAGQNKANPIATILSAAMMLLYSFDAPQECRDIENAVEKALADGYRTGDIMSEGKKLVSCSEMGDIILANL
ncbi:3-isopropylmalate dehydrogenase [Candidatus Soleaferrea massiliensis]|uniref:3-isopropylmalate dehydrogenase n=1 Tax=Candidatus Soleaferrea massiliensis TaxID=1470354 RepID=UPI00058ED1EA|nr:3-isopropylmalate dehydrogenase [Candidatus Soleaferrea massiliensis]